RTATMASSTCQTSYKWWPNLVKIAGAHAPLPTLLGYGGRRRCPMDPMRRAPPSTPAAAIETKGLFKRYGETIALDGLDLEVPRNSIFGFLGPNGAGKSTTMKLLLGLAHPTGGAARVFGLDASRDSLAVRGRVGYLAQEPRFYDYMTARETLRFVLGFFEPLGARETRLRVDEAL